MSNIQVAKVLIQNEEKHFLVVQESESEQWELPGGKIEEDEDRFEAAKREILEEVNLELRELEDVVRVEVEDRNCVNCWILHTENFKGGIEIDEEELINWKWVTSREYRELDWHADAGYAIPAMKFLTEYLEIDTKYS